VAAKHGCDALHPGYGFLAENAEFARMCAEADVKFVGPPPEAIAAMGGKTEARRRVSALGVPIVPGATTDIDDPAEGARIAAELGYPVAVKASGGGGGKGFRIVESEEQLADALAAVSNEGQRFFGAPEVYLERYFADPRHVEIQVLADEAGNVVCLGERDCSVQRRHQKLVEESPAPAVDELLQARLADYAIGIAQSIGYASAGTVEGLLVGSDFYFLEMNTRLQVEHPVTELVTGIDLVREQLRIAAGNELDVRQDEIEIRGHAIECRINAEAAHKGFIPTPGTIDAYREPGGPGVRVDSGVSVGSTVTPFYDSLLAKLIVWDTTRERATARMQRALREYEIGGVTTLIPFHSRLLESRQWHEGGTARDLLGSREWLQSTAPDQASA